MVFSFLFTLGLCPGRVWFFNRIFQRKFFQKVFCFWWKCLNRTFSKRFFVCLSIGKFKVNLSQIEFFVCPLESSKWIFLKLIFLKGIDVVFWPCQQSMNLNQIDLTIHFEKVQYFQSIICFFAGSFFLIDQIDSELEGEIFFQFFYSLVVVWGKCLVSLWIPTIVSKFPFALTKLLQFKTNPSFKP